MVAVLSPKLLLKIKIQSTNKRLHPKEDWMCIGWLDVLSCLLQVLIRVHACGVNPVETYIRAGWYPRKPTLPYTPGTDAAGVVESIGEGVTAVKVWWTNNYYIFFVARIFL